jgi:aconitate hydratase 2/2-methylisocitrate dehydratase
VALWTGKKASQYVPFINISIVAGTNGISNFLTTVDVTGGIGLDLQNWVKVVDENGNAVRNENGDVVLEEAYSVATGTVLINTKTKKLYNGDKELKDISKAFTLKKWNL